MALTMQQKIQRAVDAIMSEINQVDLIKSENRQLKEQIKALAGSRIRVDRLKSLEEKLEDAEGHIRKLIRQKDNLEYQMDDKNNIIKFYEQELRKVMGKVPELPDFDFDDWETE